MKAVELGQNMWSVCVCVCVCVCWFVSRIKPSDVFRFTLNFYKLRTHSGTLEGGSAHRKAPTYTGQHNTE
jgi:hypothetical protein